MKKDEKGLAKVAKREKYFSTLAKKEGKGATQRHNIEKRAGLSAAAKDSAWEAKTDMKFAKIRQKKAQAAKAKLQKIRGKK